MAEVLPFETSLMLDVPPIDPVNEIIATDASVFIEAPAANCVQSFTIEDKNGNVPIE